jgi:orotidine-5'-phosphate decarboxylase
MNFTDKLIEKIIQTKNPSVVGLDPRYSFVPEYIKVKYKNEIDAIYEYNCGIIDAIEDLVPAVKPQLAFYEQYGSKGHELYEKTVKYAKSKGLLILADAKRGDIGSTAEAYSKAFFTGESQADAVTLNPYMGFDTINPFLKFDGKGAIVLVKTSNPSSIDLQNLIVEGRPLYEHFGEKLNEYGKKYLGENGYSRVLAVVGATYPKEMKKLREIMTGTYFLVPGYGAQGGTAEDVVEAFDDRGLGAIVNSSRGIIAAHKKCELEDETKYTECIRQAVISMRDEINDALARADKRYW